MDELKFNNDNEIMFLSTENMNGCFYRSISLTTCALPEGLDAEARIISREELNKLQEKAMAMPA